MQDVHSTGLGEKKGVEKMAEKTLFLFASVSWLWCSKTLGGPLNTDTGSTHGSYVQPFEENKWCLFRGIL